MNAELEKIIAEAVKDGVKVGVKEALHSLPAPTCPIGIKPEDHARDHELMGKIAEFLDNVNSSLWKAIAAVFTMSLIGILGYIFYPILKLFKTGG